MKKTVKLGTFEAGPLLVVGDPGYPVGAQHQVRTKVRPGRWTAYSIIRDGLTAELYCRQEECGPDWKQMDAKIGVDSGQVGVFCAQHYRNAEIGRALLTEQLKKGTAFFNGSLNDEKGAPGLWYWAVSNLTLAKTKGNGGIIPFGCAVGRALTLASGEGDGLYDCYFAMARGAIAGVRIVFL